MKKILIAIAASTLFAAFALAQVPRYRVTDPGKLGGTFSDPPLITNAADGHDNGVTKVFTLDPSTHGNPEGVAFDPSSGAFFVGATGDGTIYRGTLDSPTATVFISGAPGMEAVGMKVARGKLYVAGGFSGAVRVYEIATKKLVASFETGGGGMLNDLVVTQTGDAFVTDSFRPTLWRITAANVAAGGGTPESIPLDPEIQYVYSPDPFNLNGIVALNGGRRLIVGQSNTGKLFRIDFKDGAPFGREIREIAVEPVFSDGLLLDKGHLIAVTFAPEETLAFIKLDGKAERGRVVERRSDPTLRGPSTVARARNFYLVVNADFADSRTPFTVTGLPRNDDEDDNW
jgi:Cu-Zn family superoxide dismutase